MKRLFVAVVLLFMTAVAWAGTTSTTTLNQLGWDDLTEEQRMQIVKAVADGKAANNAKPATAPTTTVSDVEKWVNVGTQIGQMIGGAAKEVGIAANEFAKTPVGMMATGLAVWHFAGEDILRVALHILTALGTTVCGGIIGWVIIRNSRNVVIKYDIDKVNWFGNHPILCIERSALPDGNLACAVLVGGLGVIVAVIAILSS